MNNQNTCFNCGCKFHPTRSDQLYCGKKCRLDSYKTSRTLILPIKKKWFDMILSGAKTEEYRERKPYWEKRFKNYFSYCYSPLDNDGKEWGWQFGQNRKDVIFKNGYGRNVPEFSAEVSICEKEGNPEWGAQSGETYYVLQIHRVHNRKNC